MSKFICDLGIKRVKQAIPSGDETIYYIMNVPLFRKVKSKNQCAIYIYKLKLFKLKRVSKLKALNQAIVQLNKNNEAFQKELHFLQKKYEHLIQEEKSQIEVLSKNISKMYYNNVPDYKKITLELTSACGYNCFFCPREKISRRIGNISDEDIRLVAYRLEKHLHKSIPIYTDHMGEVLTIKDFLHKINIIHEVMPNFKPHVVTTLGYKKDDEFWENYLDSPISTTVVSFYGYDAESYKYIHGRDLYDLALSNLTKLLINNTKSGGKMHFDIALNNFSEDIMNKSPNYKPTEFKKRRDDFINFLEQKNVGYFYRTIHNRGDGENFIQPVRSHKCFIGEATRKDSLVIDCELNVIPCVMDYNSQVILGNLKKQSLEEIYNSQPYKDFIKSMFTQDFSNYPICKNCGE